MNRFVIKFINEDTLVALSKLGEITYRSSIINVVFLSTTYTEEAILKVDGVIRVKRERTGRLFV